MYHPQQPHARPEWKARSSGPPPPHAAPWSGHHHHPHHHPYHHPSHVGPAPPPVHRPPPPPPIHYPPHAQHRQHQHHHHHRQAYYHHGNTGSPTARPPPPPPTRPMPHHTTRRGAGPNPALVSPSAHQAAAVSAPTPISPQPVLSSTASPGAVGNARSTSNHAAATTPGAPPNARTVATPPATSPSSAAINTNNVVTAKPPRPYTEYTMFYQLEREFILHRILTTDQERAHNHALAANQPALFQNDPLMPARYRSLPLRADWYISGKSKKPTKRKHRKSHGKIGFLELTRMIAARWAKVDDETRKYCKMMAAMELVKYKEDMESYNSYKERLSEIGEIPEDMKERMLKKQRAQEKKDAADAKKKGLSKPQSAPTTPKEKQASKNTIKADTVNSSSGIGTTTARGTSPKQSANNQIKLEPIAHDSPHDHAESCTNTLDNDMEEFITSLVTSPKASTTKKIVTPDRSNIGTKKRRLFREKRQLPTASNRHDDDAVTAAAASALGCGVEMHVPLKDDDDDHLDGIKMTFSGIDENEMAREFSDHVVNATSPGGGAASGSGTATPPPPHTPVTMVKTTEAKPSFDYWDALVESPHL